MDLAFGATLVPLGMLLYLFAILLIRDVLVSVVVPRIRMGKGPLEEIDNFYFFPSKWMYLIQHLHFEFRRDFSSALFLALSVVFLTLLPLFGAPALESNQPEVLFGLIFFVQIFLLNQFGKNLLVWRRNIQVGRSILIFTQWIVILVAVNLYYQTSSFQELSQIAFVGLRSIIGFIGFIVLYLGSIIVVRSLFSSPPRDHLDYLNMRIMEVILISFCTSVFLNTRLEFGGGAVISQVFLTVTLIFIKDLTGVFVSFFRRRQLELFSEGILTKISWFLLVSVGIFKWIVG